MKCLLFLGLLVMTISQDIQEEAGVLILENNNFDRAIQEHPYILVEFYDTKCQSCNDLAPLYSQAAGILKSLLPLAKVDVSSQKVLAARYSLKYLPTLIFFRQGLKQEYTGPKTFQDIVDWVSVNLSPLFSSLDSEDKLKEFVKQNEHAVVYFEKENEDTNQLQRIADLSNELGFKISLAKPTLKQSMNVKEPVEFLLYNKEQLSFYQGKVENHLLKVILQQAFLPLVFTYTTQEIKFIQSLGQPALYFWDSPTTVSFREEFSKLAQEYKGKISFVNIQGINLQVVSKFIEEMAVPELKAGWIYINDFKNKAKYVLDGEELTRTSVKAFIEKFLLGKLEKISIPVAIYDGPVRIITSDTFESVVKNSKEEVLLQFYAPWDEKCQKLSPIYEELAHQMFSNKNLIIAKIDSTKYTLPNIQIDQYPAIMFFKKGDLKSYVLYEEEKNLESFLQFLQAYTSYPWVEITESKPEIKKAPAVNPYKSDQVTIVTVENYKEVVLNSPTDVLLEFYAPWCGYCQRFSPTYDELALKLKDDQSVVIAKVDIADKDIPDMEIKLLPTLKFYKKGAEPSIIDYPGARTIVAIEKFIQLNKSSQEPTVEKTKKIDI